MSTELFVRPHRLRAQPAGRLRGDQQGAGDPAHAADVRRQRHPRRRAGRRDAARGDRDTPSVGYVLLFVAAAFAAMNVVGGYVVTDRMLEMFRARPGRRRRSAE